MATRLKNPPKLVIIDRDGTLGVYREDYIKAPEEWEPVPGALEAIAQLNRAGWHVVVATNQPGVGRGVMDMAALNAVHAVMHRQLAAAGARVDAVFFCPHAAEDNCDCRKPAPGLLLQIGQRHGVDLAQVHAVGDALRDVQAAAAAGCIPHLVCTGEGAQWRECPLDAAFPANTQVHKDLLDFAQILLAQQEQAASMPAASEAPAIEKAARPSKAMVTSIKKKPAVTGKKAPAPAKKTSAKSSGKPSASPD